MEPAETLLSLERSCELAHSAAGLGCGHGNSGPPRLALNKDEHRLTETSESPSAAS